MYYKVKLTFKWLFGYELDKMYGGSDLQFGSIQNDYNFIILKYWNFRMIKILGRYLLQIISLVDCLQITQRTQ